MGEKIKVHGKALIFGKMMDLAWPRVKDFRSDFYHDALFLRESIHLPAKGETVSFYYAIKEYGTNIYRSKEYYEQVRSTSTEHEWYHFSILGLKHDLWEVTVTSL